MSFVISGFYTPTSQSIQARVGNPPHPPRDVDLLPAPLLIHPAYNFPHIAAWEAAFLTLLTPFTFSYSFWKQAN